MNKVLRTTSIFIAEGSTERNMNQMDEEEA